MDFIDNSGLSWVEIDMDRTLLGELINPLL